MKKLLFFAVLLFTLPAYAKAPYGFTPYYPQQENYKYSAIYKMLSGQPIKYNITIAHPKFVPQEERLNLIITEEKLSKDIEVAFNVWLAGMSVYIKNAKRTKEFADILNKLPQRIKLEKVSDTKQTDIFFTFTDKDVIKKICGPDVLACHTTILPFGINQILAPNPLLYKDINIFNILIHETGHYFGLSDQYAKGLSSAQYSNDRIHKGVSVMEAADIVYGCDDADGFINLIDYTLARMNNGRYSQRAQKGWLTFCGDDSYYIKAKPYIRNYCFVRYNPKTKKEEQICPEPFMFLNKQYNLKNGLLSAMYDKPNNVLIRYRYFLNENRISVTARYGGLLNQGGPAITMQIMKNEENSWRIPLYGKIYNFTLKDGKCTYSQQDRLYAFQRTYDDNKDIIDKSKSVYEFSIQNDINSAEFFKTDTPFLPQNKFKNTFLYPQSFSAEQKVCAYLKEVTSKMPHIQ